MAMGAPKPVKAVLQADLRSLLAVGLQISTCLCLVGAAVGLLLCGALAVLLCIVNAALWVAACAEEACISHLNQGATVHFKPPNLATEMLRPSCSKVGLQPLGAKPGAAARSPPSPKQKELIMSWSGAAVSGHPGSTGREEVDRDVTPETSPRSQSEEIEGPDTPAATAATQQLFADCTSTKGSPGPDVDFAQDVDRSSQTPSGGNYYDHELDGGFEVSKSRFELTAEAVPAKDVSAIPAMAAVAEVQQPATPPSTDLNFNFDLIMFGSEAEEAAAGKADNAQPITQLENQLSDGNISSTAAAKAHQPQSVDGPSKLTATVATAKAPSKTIKGKKVLEAVRLLENKAKTEASTRESVLQKVTPERILATIQGRSQQSVRNLSLQIDKRTSRTGCTKTVLPMPPTAHALCSAAASTARWDRQSSGKFCCC